MSTKISVTSELMQNYKQASIMSPQNKFEALQDNEGKSLLFSIGTDNVFYLTEETPGTPEGWTTTDMSSALIASAYHGQSGITCKTFEAGQSVADGSIGLAMALTDGSNDCLYLCLGNSNADTGWAQNPTWVAYPYDNPDQPESSVKIVNIELSETANNTQYIVVDILRDPSSPEQLVSRFYIDTTKLLGYSWQIHDVSIDLEAALYTSCLGRQYLSNSAHQPTIDGLYTCGQVGGDAQFIFQPLYNVYDPGTPGTAENPGTPGLPAPAVRLSLPGSLIADSMASCRKSNQSTDLYVASKGGLYYFASSNQNDGSVGQLLLQNSLFNGVSKMFASESNGTVTVWGLNGSDNVFYVSCPAASVTTASAWSVPVPIVTGVDLFSPYINIADGSNSFFAVAGNTLEKWVKSPETSIWSPHYITLPTLDMNDTQSYNSYTTTIQLTDDSNQPVTATPVTIRANTRTGVYINNLYYVIDSIGVEVNTDAFGNITVIEWTDSLVGTQLIVSGSTDGKTSNMNPMDGPMSQIAALNTVDSLQSAVITNDDGSTKPLVSSSVSDSDLQAVADNNAALGNAYSYLSDPGSSQMALLVTPMHRQSLIQLNVVDAIWVDAGDLFNWLKSGVEAIVQVIEDVANKVWTFVATIAGEVYAAVLDVVEKVIEAAIWIFNAIEVALEDLIKFLQFLFGWGDILTTHNVMKNVFTQFAQTSIDSLGTCKQDLAALFSAVESSIDQWANIPSFGQTPASVTASSTPMQGQNSSPANLGLHHYQSNASSATSDVSGQSLTVEMFTDLKNLLVSEGETLKAACDAIQTDIIEPFNTLTVTEIIQRFVAIIADTLLESAENVIDAAIDLFMQLSQGMLDVLNATIEIPVLSWLYKELTGNELSFLDLVCLISAIPATIIYKLSAGVAPFPQNDPFTESLINATGFDQIRQAFYADATPAAKSTLMLAKDPLLDQDKLKIIGFVSDLFAFMGSAVLIVTVTIQRLTPKVFPKTMATVAAVANLAYISPNYTTLINIATGNVFAQMNNVLTIVSGVKGFVNIGIAGMKVKADQEGCALISAFIESFINLIWNIPVIMNIDENADDWDTTYKSLIPESCGNFCFNLGGIMEFPCALTPRGTALAVESGVQFGLMLLYGVFMPVAGGIYAFSDNQEH